MAISFGSNMNIQRQQQQRENQKRYDDVYAHELKHKQAAGSYGGSIVIERDANGIVTGGHVDIKMPTLDKNDPDETIKHANIVIDAAMAPDDPSDQDYKVAAEARAIKAEAQSCKSSSNGQQNATCGQKLNIVA